MKNFQIFSFNKSYVAIFAFFLYCVYNFLYLSSNTIFPDESRFIGEAVHFAEFGEFRIGSEKAWEMPLAGMFYGLIYFLAGSEMYLVYGVRLIQSFMLILQAYLMAEIALILFKDIRVSSLTFMAILFYPFFIFYQGLLLSETIFITLLIGSFYFLYRWYEEGFQIDRNFYLFMALITLSVYTKATLSLLVPVLAPLLVVLITKKIGKSFQILFLSMVLYGLFLSPWWIRNYIIFDSFVPFSTSSGMNFYLGNNEHNFNGGCDWGKDAEAEKVKRLNAIENEIERNKAFTSEAKQFINEHPRRFLELAWLKLKRYYNVVPNAEGFNSGLYKWISLLSYGIVLVLAIIGAIITGKEYKKLSVIYLLFTYFTLIHIVIIASLRYRLPLEPFMILFASVAITSLYDKFLSRDQLKN